MRILTLILCLLSTLSCVLAAEDRFEAFLNLGRIVSPATPVKFDDIELLN
jgi:hypothetical protein